MKKAILNGLILATCTGLLSANEYVVNKKFQAHQIIVTQIFEPAEEIVEAEIIDSMEINSQYESFSESDDDRLPEKKTTKKKNPTMSKTDKILAEQVKELKFDGIEKENPQHWEKLAKELQEKDFKKKSFNSLKTSLYKIMRYPTLEKEEKEIYRQLAKTCGKIYRDNNKKNKKRSNDGETIQERSSKRQRLDPEVIVSKPKESPTEEHEVFGVGLLSGGEPFSPNEDMGLNNSSNMELVSGPQPMVLPKIELEKQFIDNNILAYMEFIQYMELNPSVEKEVQKEVIAAKIILSAEKNSSQGGGVATTFFESAGNITLQGPYKNLVEILRGYPIIIKEKNKSYWENLVLEIKEKDAQKRDFCALQAAFFGLENNLSADDEKKICHQLGNACNRIYRRNNRENKKRLNDGEIVQERSSKKRRLDPEGIVSKSKESPMEEKEEQKKGMDTEIVQPAEKNSPQDRVLPPFLELRGKIVLQEPSKNLVEILRSYQINNIEEKTKSNWEDLALEIKGKDVKKRTFSALSAVFFGLQKKLSTFEEQRICNQLGNAYNRLHIRERSKTVQ